MVVVHRNARALLGEARRSRESVVFATAARRVRLPRSAQARSQQVNIVRMDRAHTRGNPGKRRSGNRGYGGAAARRVAWLHVAHTGEANKSPPVPGALQTPEAGSSSAGERSAHQVNPSATARLLTSMQETIWNP